MNRTQERLKSYDQAPRTRELLLSKAHFLALEKRGEDLHALYGELLARDAGDVTAAAGIASALVLMKRYDEASAAFDATLLRQYFGGVYTANNLIVSAVGNVEHARVRELVEETGYRAAEWARAGHMHNAIAYSTEAIEVWFARGLVKGDRRLDPGEFLDVLETSEDELARACGRGEVTDAKTLVGLLWLQNWRAGRWPLRWDAAP